MHPDTIRLLMQIFGTLITTIAGGGISYYAVTYPDGMLIERILRTAMCLGITGVVLVAIWIKPSR